ncbi:hypothetical protein ACFLT8_01110 [Chloroflexota bacterium]
MERFAKLEGPKIRWFKDHPNWTLLIGLFSGIGLYAIANVVSWYVLLRVVALIVMLIPQIYYLNRKSRGMGWLLLNLMGVAAYAGDPGSGLESATLAIGPPTLIAGLLMLFLKSKKELVAC